jgi:ATP-dependent DNA helicase RecG
MTHPDRIASPEEIDKLQAVEPVYPLTAGLTARPLARAVAAALERAPELQEWSDAAYRAREGWPSWRASLAAAHAPAAESDLAPTTKARRRLAFDELLANQLALALVRARQKRQRGRPTAGDGRLRDRALASLPFRLTASQERALDEILADAASDERMLRLLQGDVGSGKTVVAFLAMLNAVEAGRQAALMAPTEILARQHFATIEPIAAAAGVPVALLTGRDKGKAREHTLAALAAGDIAITIGTHALFQEEVEFRDLALAVVDEQHRFGVHQRLTWAAKGRAADVLVMTATPIPRTLMMTAYGDLDVSRLTDKPPGRKSVDTRALPLARLEDVVGRLSRAIRDGARIYWVCPLVEESELLDLAAATERAAMLAERFPGRVGLVHGRLKARDKDEAMARFAAGDIDILVATTVIEVGVDVPEATVMVIEHAERFGLAQLHQLRGRIGRGERASTCLLLYAAPLGEAARARIEIMRETDDGFRIAEEDLRLRGAGEVLGTRQSGLPVFRLADLVHHQDLLAAATDDAKLTLERDPDLAGERGQALRTLLYLFERDAAVVTLRSG